MAVIKELDYYKLRNEDRELLRKPFGPVIQNPKDLPKFVPRNAVFFAVGDRTAFEALNAGVRVQSFFYDCLEKRMKTGKEIAEFLESVPGFKAREVTNPAGTITRDLFKAVLESAKKHLRVKILGEEDLATLALFATLDDGAVIAYGMPMEGMCIAVVNEEIRTVARKLLQYPHSGTTSDTTKKASG